jgi:hypothetical protein
MLGAALELRHAHWLWIHDLSASDPLLYILPILMVVSMLVVQKMTPQAGHGSGAAENADGDDAADDGVHLLPAACRTESLLRRGELDFESRSRR